MSDKYPRDDEPFCAQRMPYSVQLEAQESYWWCACGRSKTQPFCDGSHVGTSFEPIEYTSEQSIVVYLCGCKQTNTAPFCDGTHATLP